MSFGKLASLVLITLLLSCTASAQPSPVGDWSGTLNFGGGALRLIFHITESENGYSATIESVDQGGAIIPTDIDVDGSSLVFRVEQIDVVYRAEMTGNQIVGEFTQFGMSMPNFTITRNQ